MLPVDTIQEIIDIQNAELNNLYNEKEVINLEVEEVEADLGVATGRI